MIGVIVVALGGAAAADVGPFGGAGDADRAGLVLPDDPQVVGRGQTSDGAEASIRHSRMADRLRPERPATCVSARRGAVDGGGEAGRPGSGRVCGPAPQEGRLTFAVDTVAPGGAGGTDAAELHRFVSGFTTGEASKVVIRDSAGRTATLDVAAAEDGRARVFWGPIPSAFRDGKVSLRALGADGSSVAQATLSTDERPPGVPPLR